MAQSAPAIDQSRLDSIRNIGILAHVDAGKTSITERILFLAGLRRSAGAVDEGTTATDYLSVERRHGITVKSAAVRLGWSGCDIHLIDTPGHVDFGNEVERVLRILDGAVIALCAVSGVQARTEVIARACAERKLPRLYFVNKMDRTGADFVGVIDNLRLHLEPDAIAIQFPLIEERMWVGTIDLVSMELTCFDGKARTLDTLGDSGREASIARDRLIEKLAEHSDLILSLYANNGEVAQPVLAQALAEAVASGGIAPVLCGSAFVEGSIRNLLDAVVRYLPSPVASRIPVGVDPDTGAGLELTADASAPLAAFVFKTLKDASGDLFAWTRIWSGTVRAGRKVFDARSRSDVMIRKIFGIHADSLAELDSAGAGEVIALKVSALESGASLCERAHPRLFEALVRPEPVVSQVVEPASLEDLSAVRKALESLAVEDSSLRVREERETGRFEIEGQGELHLDIVAERLKRDFGLRVKTGNPRVNCRERLCARAQAREEFDRDFGGERVRVTVAVTVEPSGRGAVSKGEGAPGGAPSPHHFHFPALKAPAQYLAAARRGAESALAVGPSEGWPLASSLITFTELSLPSSGPGRNGEIAVEAASALAVRAATLLSGSLVLEPFMRIDIECPEDYFGAALASISSRGGRVESVEDKLASKGISGIAPMRALFGFASELRSLSKGRAEFQARFSGYEPVRQPVEPSKIS